MNTQTVTLNGIRKLGIEALTTHLGVVGMIRFLQQGETGWGNYTNDREKWLGNPSLEKIYKEIQNLTKSSSWPPKAPLHSAFGGRFSLAING